MIDDNAQQAVGERILGHLRARGQLRISFDFQLCTFILYPMRSGMRNKFKACGFLSALFLLTWPGFCIAQDTEAQIYARCPGAAAWNAKHPGHIGSSGVIDASNRGLHDELLSMAKKDTEARNAWKKDGFKVNPGNPSQQVRNMSSVDEANLVRLKRITNNGSSFPLAKQIGSDGIDAAWLIVQHADRDPDFQAKILKLLKPFLNNGYISAHDYALLADRVAVARNKPQAFGSQFYFSDGALRPHLFDSVASVNSRRRSIGLMPLQDYACGLHVITGKSVSLTPK